MTWVTILLALCSLLSLTGLVGLLVLYIQFCNSAEKRWATAVHNRLRDAQSCIRSENQQLRALNAQRDAEARSLLEEQFAKHLGDYSVNELDAYPGIGPGTIGKLRGAGFDNLATLSRARIRIHGLGEKRLADIKSAIRDLLRKARSTFDEGECRRAHSLADQLQTLSARYDRLEATARMRARAAEQFIHRLGETVAYARTVRFWRWFRPISDESLIPSEVMNAPLPDLEAALREAEHRVNSNETAKRPMPANALPISPACQAVPHDQAATHASASASKAKVEMADGTHLMSRERTIQPTGPMRDDYLRVLEISAGTTVSADVVRRQWNLLSERLDPAKLTSMGPEFVELAQTKLAALRQAAEWILKAMGEKLDTKPATPPVLELRHNPDLDDVLGGM